MQARTLWWVADPALASACFVAVTLPLLVTGGGEGPAWAIGLLGAGACVPVAVRRRWPAPVLGAVSLVLALAALTAVRFTPFVSNAGPALAIAVYTVAVRLPRRRSLPWTLVAVLTVSVATAIALAVHPHRDQDAVQLVIAILAWLAGDVVRTRTVLGHELTRQRDARAVDHEARIRAEERLRLSRDVHDVVSHTLSMIAVRSGVARSLARQDPDQAYAALADIETASRTALGELRSVLRDTRSGGPEPAEPGLADLPRLAGTARAAGLEVSLCVTAAVCDTTLATSVYRIVQEALTNVVKHADATAAVVEVADSADEVVVRVSDDGRGRGDAVDGIGTQGMRERVALFDGSLSFGPRPDGCGHEIRARLRRRG